MHELTISNLGHKRSDLVFWSAWILTAPMSAVSCAACSNCPQGVLRPHCFRGSLSPAETETKAVATRADTTRKKYMGERDVTAKGVLLMGRRKEKEKKVVKTARRGNANLKSLGKMYLGIETPRS